MASSKNKREGRLFNPHGLKHYRRQHNLSELWWGLFVFVVLFGTGAWVAYKGAHPDPNLFKDGAKLLLQAKKRIKVVERRPHSTSLRQSHKTQPSPTPRRTTGPGEKLLPASLGGTNWTKAPTQQFSAKTMYEKINGRAGYYQAYGCKQLFFTKLRHKKTGKTIDVELYDMGTSVNALGAYAGEMSTKATPEVGQRGMSHISRNALYVSRGPYYLRVIGDDESPIIKHKLAQIKTFFEKQIKGVPLPWAYGLFVAVSVKASAISYARENAFSFGFGKDVYTGKIGKNTYLFINAQNTAKAAQSLSAKFRKGWLSYGSKEKGADGIIWVKDRYISTYATAVAVERWVVGVQGATDFKRAQKALARLRQAVTTMPTDLRKRARPTPRTQPSKKRKHKPTLRTQPSKRRKHKPTLRIQPTKKRKHKPTPPGHRSKAVKREHTRPPKAHKPKPAQRIAPEEGYDAKSKSKSSSKKRKRRVPSSRPSRPKPRAYESGIDER